MWKLSKVSQIRTSVCPQTDSPVGRFNKTYLLKGYLFEWKKNWDQLIPLVWFSIWEVPRRSGQTNIGETAISPLVRHRVCGPDAREDGWNMAPSAGAYATCPSRGGCDHTQYWQNIPFGHLRAVLGSLGRAGLRLLSSVQMPQDQVLQVMGRNTQ